MPRLQPNCKVFLGLCIILLNVHINSPLHIAPCKVVVCNVCCIRLGRLGFRLGGGGVKDSYVSVWWVGSGDVRSICVAVFCLSA